MKKIFTFTLAFALVSPLMADSLRIFKCTEDGIPGQTEPQLIGLSMSGDGRFICGTVQQGSGLFVADCTTGDVKWEFAGEESSELRGVDNQGVGIGFVDNSGALFSFDNAKESLIKAPEGVRYVQGEDISDDGNVMVGSFTAQSFNTEAAYSLAGGDWNVLPVPTDDEKGNLKDFMNSMSAAKYVSSDGSVISGHLGSFSFPMVWTRNEAGEYVADFFPARYIKAVEADRYDESKPLYGLTGQYVCMSPNGKYVGTVGLIANEENTATRIAAVIYNTVDKTLKIYSQPQEIDEFELGLYPRAIANDGTFIGTVDATASSANYGAFIMKAGQEQAELYIDAFPAYSEVFLEADLLGQNIPTGISADGKHLLGYTFYSKDYDISSEEPAYFVTYVISLEEDAVDEISSGSMDRDAAIYSIDGRTLSHLQKGLNIVRNSDGSVTKILK